MNDRRRCDQHPHGQLSSRIGCDTRRCTATCEERWGVPAAMLTATLAPLNPTQWCPSVQCVLHCRGSVRSHRTRLVHVDAWDGVGNPNDGAPCEAADAIAEGGTTCSHSHGHPRGPMHWHPIHTFTRPARPRAVLPPCDPGTNGASLLLVAIPFEACSANAGAPRPCESLGHRRRRSAAVRRPPAPTASLPSWHVGWPSHVGCEVPPDSRT